MVNSGSKLILILSPEIKAYIQQLADDDDTCRLLQKAMKVTKGIGSRIILNFLLNLLGSSFCGLSQPFKHILYA